MIPEKYRELFWDKVEKTGSCWNWTASTNPKGYGHFGVSGKVKFAHRISYQMHKGEIPDGLCVCHACDNPRCVNPDHLWLGTHQDNAIDREMKGRGGRCGPPSSKARAAKLTDDKVREIKKLLRAGQKTQRQIATEFAVHHATINDIAMQKTWRNT